MAIVDAIIGPVAGLLDKLIPDPKARDAAKLELLRLENTQDIERLRQQMAAVIAEAQSPDPWTSRARPMFLYVMYALLLWAMDDRSTQAVFRDSLFGETRQASRQQVRTPG